jgi:A/G-specific adenine glycosylase
MKRLPSFTSSSGGSAGPSTPSGSAKRTAPLRAALLRHYDRAARDLPWRGEADPYRILVSEVMLQQTRVETVKKYYEPWLTRFPDVETLADADEDEVLKAWEGLGYYRRARNLHRAVRVVRERPDGAIPSGYTALRALPGVGEYTAGAVASIAFGEATPAVDGNVRRVLSRLFDRAAPEPAWLRSTAEALVDRERPGDWNQALMELGATVCTARNPKCGSCPVRRWCAALSAGTVAVRPGARAARGVRTARLVLGVFHAQGEVLLVRRPRRGLLGGMWAFPEREVIDEEPRAAVDVIAGELGVTVAGCAKALPECEHRFTHLHAVYVPWAVRVEVGARKPRRAGDPGGPLGPGDPGDRRGSGGPRGSRGSGDPRPHDASRDRARWVSIDDASALALPVAQRRVLESWGELAR